MRVAFVGVKRKYQELAPEYRDFFTKYHLELPWYYARDGRMDVSVTTVDDYDGCTVFDEDGKDVCYLAHVPEKDFGKGINNLGMPYDVVVHWRKWFPEFYRPEAINVINCQDHSFSPEWKRSVGQAFIEKKLFGILCFPTWHKRNLLVEMKGYGMAECHFIDGLTLGVDTDIYKPSEDKDPYQLLWASDPGRGLNECIQMFMQLFRIDQRFKLNVCWPDYCNFKPPFQHPGIVWHGNVPNGPELWELFNGCGVLPYTSNFLEPSSRAHRQAQAAGSLVLYPSGRGTPSELIKEAPGWQQGDLVGVVSDPVTWPTTINTLVKNGKWKDIGSYARRYAISENWSVQAQRFKRYFEERI